MKKTTSITLSIQFFLVYSFVLLFTFPIKFSKATEPVPVIDQNLRTRRERMQKIKEIYGYPLFYELYFSTLNGSDSPKDLHQKIATLIWNKVTNENWQLTDGLGLNIFNLAALTGDDKLMDHLLDFRPKAQDLYNTLSTAILYPLGSDTGTILRYQLIIKRLIEAGANIHAQSRELHLFSPLSRALRFGRFESAKTLLAYGAKMEEDDLVGNSLLATAIASCDEELIAMMIAKGAQFRILDFKSSLIKDQLEHCPQRNSLLSLISPLFPNPNQNSISFSTEELLKKTVDAYGGEKHRQSIIRANDFCVNRSWDLYEQQLGCGEFVSSLKEGDHVMDAGAGEGLAMIDLAKLKPELHLTAISYTLTSDPYQELNPEQSSKFHLIKNQFFEEIPQSALLGDFGKFKAIFDFWGVFAYSTAPDKILRRYVDLLCENGKIFLMTGSQFLDDLYTKRSSFIGTYSRQNSTLHRSKIKTKQGELISFLHWFDLLQGFSVENFSKAKILSVSNPNHLFIPALKMIKFIDHSMKPPGYLFEEE